MGNEYLTLRLIKVREEMRFLCGTSYDEEVKEYIDLVRAEMKRSGSDNPIDAAITLARLAANGEDMAAHVAARMSLAAAVEVIAAQDPRP